MYQSTRIEAFEKLVRNKFDIYNSLFLNLPYSNESKIGMLIPLLYDKSKNGLDEGQNPGEVLESFFETYAHIKTEKGRIDFMFRVIQYVERQVVLFDSVEDAAFINLRNLSNDLSIIDFFQLLKTKNQWENIADKLSTFSARIVLTAHPTQFYPPSVLDIIGRLRMLISENNINEIDIILQQLGLTSLIKHEKPTPLEEAKNIIYFLRNIYYNAVGDLYSYIKVNIRNNDFDNHNIIKIGFWPGGDRDGNPFVTTDITMAVADELRMNLMQCYYEEISILLRQLTFGGIEQILKLLRDQIYETIFNPKKTIFYDDIIKPLYEIRELLLNNYHRLYLNNLDKLIDKVKIFRTHFAALDIRQDHRIHKKVVEEILKNENIIKTNLEELGDAELLELLLHKEIRVKPFDFEDDLVKDTISNIMQLKKIQIKNGEEGCNRYIISNSEDIFSVLFVYALFHWCGWDRNEITFDIIPLFETMQGMETSENSMRTLLELSEYKEHLIRRGSKQTIMLGFSDGTKDGGYIMANWSIFKTKEKLSQLCEKYQIKPIFFDGRGGPPARGGGKTHSFYAAQSNLIANHEIQLTIQGQTITSKYGTQEQFIHNCEQLLTAGLSNDISGKENIITDEQRQLLEELSNISYQKYTELKQHKMFIPYLENKSTLKYYDRANIGSRPGKRGNTKTLQLSDLRAISFVGSWSQLKQNVPGYYGTGTAIHTLVEKGKLEELKRMFQENGFFKALMLNSMMSLSKSNFSLTAYMGQDPEYREFWNLLYQEFELSKEMLLLISGFKILMEEEPISRESIKVREKIVLPLLVIQQYALQKISQGTSSSIEIYEKIVTRSLYGNINASRNSV
jgi:phosphoenolpyruvate carboxylase